MKKILLASTALVIGAAVQANAAEPLTASVGGYMNAGIAAKDGEDGLGVMRDGEIHFNVKGSSDNGLTFDARVELEAFTSDSTAVPAVGGDEPDFRTGDQIDENWVRVSGSFGSIKIGGDDSAKAAYANGVIYAPSALIGYYDGFGYLGGVQPGISGANDSIGIHYDSPDFNGFRFGATYQPSLRSDNFLDTNVPVYNKDFQPLCDELGVESCPAEGNNAWSVGAVYHGDFDGFGFALSAGYQDTDDSDSDTWHVGGNVSTAGFTLAVQYEDNPGSGDSSDLAVGVSYATGPWTIAGGWSQQDNDGGSPDPQVFSAWVTYAMAPGVKATAGFEYGDPDDGDDETLGGMVYLNLGF